MEVLKIMHVMLVAKLTLALAVVMKEIEESDVPTTLLAIAE